MTAKEKALDLFMDIKFEIPYIHDPTEPQDDDIAKKCALILIDELIKETGSKYWYNVKQEIENL
jgi:hypothetical protein